MTDWIDINGARIKRSFLEENVLEARGYAWVTARPDQIDDHRHCMICNLALAKGCVLYRSDGGWLCAYCFSTFLEPKLPGG